ncbi:calnexin [Heterostelium album PN500]|uniref:Calnexin n=1 Tax=Heterostelium pallidum (strain ATCC 26659 / Pp 5 / PN500) TaxID=670386 RepID=D3BHU2_HETP5|nr:calnexin [Heterostelium album PN500]EFA78842.1 calnexin [Heterostelium album PN500]|eukprot:XP_020430966.1 calnexin [Heterostelium album PN500]
MRIVYLTIILSIVIGSVLSFTPGQSTVFFDDFQSLSQSRWVKSVNSEADFEIRAADNTFDPSDKGMVLPQLAKRYAITSKLVKPIDNTGKELLVQYEVKLQNGLDCGGAYIKLFQDTENFDVEQVNGNTPYSIMFGPDKCGSDNRIHFIVQSKNPITKTFQEKLIEAKPAVKTDTLSHLYSLHIKPDNTFVIYLDQVNVYEGSFHKNFVPAFNPPKEIDDPSDHKPVDWVDDEKMPDPEAVKPDDWDEDQPSRITDPDAVKPAEWLDNEPEYIPSPDEEKPSEWNDEDDGEWEAPMIPNPRCQDGMCGKWAAPIIPNPLYKGKWSAPMIDNPLYKGVWKAKQIANPEYFEIENPYIVEKIGAIGVEIWTMSPNIYFDNFIITHDKSEADRLAAETWAPKFKLEKERQAKEEEEKAKKLNPELSLVDQALMYIDMFTVYAKENPVPVIGAAVLGLLPLLICMVKPSSSAAQTTKANTTAGSTNTTTTTTTKKQSETPQIESDSSEEEEEEEEEEKPKSKKRTSKVN